MNSFYIRMINVILIICAVLGYNSVVSSRAQADQISQLTADLESAKLQLEVYEKEFAAQKEKSGNGEIAQESEEGLYKNGTYQGEAQGYGGPIDVSVTIDGGQITGIEVISAEKEDTAYLAMAKGIIDKMLEAQTSEVDTITGATFSSTGIKNAVTEALSQAQ